MHTIAPPPTQNQLSAILCQPHYKLTLINPGLWRCLDYCGGILPKSSLWSRNPRLPQELSTDSMLSFGFWAPSKLVFWDFSFSPLRFFCSSSDFSSLNFLQAPQVSLSQDVPHLTPPLAKSSSGTFPPTHPHWSEICLLCSSGDFLKPIILNLTVFVQWGTAECSLIWPMKNARFQFSVSG